MIEVKNLNVKIDGKKILDNINCHFEKNKISVIIGPSGSGKTTLLYSMNGIIPFSSGEIIIDNQKFTTRNLKNINTKSSMVFQSFNLFPHMNVIENLIYTPMIINKISKKEAIEKAQTILTKLGLSLKAKDFPKDLSGGQKQRAAIARALMMDKKTIFFDEPTSALDPESIRDFMLILDDLRQDQTILIVTHHFKFAAKIADYIYFMDKGLLLDSQPSEDFINNPKSHRARLFLETVDLM